LPNMALLSHWEGEAVELWRTLWEAPHLEIHESLESTNDRVKELIREEGAPWSLVLSEAQLRGRGRGGKSWFSPPGQGLLFSLLVRSRGTEWDALLPLRAGMAAAQAVDDLLSEAGWEVDASMGLKWPNDLVLKDRKVGGILCEKTGQHWVVLGMGVNVHQSSSEFPPDLEGIADSLEGVSGARVARSRLMGGIMGGLREWLSRDGSLLEDEELLGYKKRDALQGHRVNSELEGIGIAQGITDKGSLRLELPWGGFVEVRAGSVRRV
jgi:BirA family biotin operon repressor/biotin-[acetyl-CoA-carboxylase] ligase